MYLLTVVLLWTCLLLGGATRYGYLSEVILQLLAIPVLLMAIWKSIENYTDSTSKWVLLFCLILASVPLLQLVPLPPDIWSTLPGREDVNSVMKLAFKDLPWMPLSLSPRSTWLSFLAMLPPFAIFLAVCQLNYRERRMLSLQIIAFGIASVFLGFLQLLGGTNSSLRFYEITNYAEAVGFFANRNHFAALLYTSMLLSVSWIFAKLTKPEQTHASKTFLDQKQLVIILAGFTIIVAFIAGILMARSRAGLGLTMIALIGIYLMGYNDNKDARKNISTKLIMSGAALAILFSTQYALFRVMERFETSISDDLRIIFAQVTSKASWETMPFGTGLGSFVQVFKQYETVSDLPARLYANHAHNDYLEVWLETGVVGILIICLFIVIYLFRSYKIWRYPLVKSQNIDHLLAKSATIIIFLILLNSLVEYPLRTMAMLVIFAYCCALLIEPYFAGKSRSEEEFYEDKYKQKSKSRSKFNENDLPKRSLSRSAQTANPIVENNSPSDKSVWEDIDWPEEWHNPSKSPPKEPKD